MANRQQRERKSKVIAADCATSANSEGLRDIRGENLRSDNHCKNGGHDRSPQHREQTGPTMFNIGSMF